MAKKQSCRSNDLQDWSARALRSLLPKQAVKIKGLRAFNRSVCLASRVQS